MIGFYPDGHRVIWGHRGYPARYPENSLQGFTAARTHGVDGIECDLRVTLDGEIVVIHDFLVDRTTNGKGAVKEWRWPDLRRLYLRNPDGTLSGERIPRLDEVLEAMDRDSLINLELKAAKSDGAYLLAAVTQAVHQHRAQNRVVVSSFNLPLLFEFRAMAPDIPVAMLLGGRLPNVKALAQWMDSRVIHIDQESYDQEDVSDWLADGLQVGVYGIWRAGDIREMEGIQAVFLDDPGWGWE